MFKLVEAASPDPMRFPIKPGTKLTPGDVVRIVEYQGDMVTERCDGYSALGLLGNRCIGGEDVDFSKMAKIYPQRMIADVGRFDKRSQIEVGSSLYCSKRGVLSSKKPFAGAMILAKVITPASKEKKHMQILWL